MAISLDRGAEVSSDGDVDEATVPVVGDAATAACLGDQIPLRVEVSRVRVLVQKHDHDLVAVAIVELMSKPNDLNLYLCMCVRGEWGEWGRVETQRTVRR